MIIARNFTNYMAPEDDRGKVTAYAEAVDAALQTGKLDGPLTTRCPECGSDFADLDEAYEDTEHILVATTSDTIAVVVGCEGYFVIDPNLVGIPSPNWTADALGDELPPVCVLTVPTDDISGPDWDRPVTME